MSTGIKNLETEVKAVRAIISFTQQVESLRQERDEAEAMGNITESLEAFGKLVAVIAAGPGAALAQAVA